MPFQASGGASFIGRCNTLLEDLDPIGSTPGTANQILHDFSRIGAIVKSVGEVAKRKWPIRVGAVLSQVTQWKANWPSEIAWAFNKVS